MKNLLLLGTCLIIAVLPCASQIDVSGKIVDPFGDALIGATIIELSSSNGTVSNLDGSFSLNIRELPTAFRVSYLGYKSVEVDVKSLDILIIAMEEISNKLDEVVVVGSRGKPRTILASPVPIDNINADELRSSGQKSIDQMINYKVPSYNSSNQTISDATAHFDPSELRNMGPSRTLVLINGKKKNQSSLVYVNDTPGKGEVGVDMKSIPSAAVERIEVLRDGASAQYGSDAIAGVINIILKERPTDGSINLESGITTEGDGLLYSGDINKGFRVGQAGYFNITGSFYHQDETNRAGEPGGDGLFGVIFEDDAILNGSHPWIQQNPNLGMTIGQPNYTALSGFANFGIPYSQGKGEFYAFGGYTFRDGKSFALYRAPYWVGSDFGLLTPSGESYNGFQPTFETDIGDATFNIGNRYNFNGWNTDISLSTGSNSVDYLIGNTINLDLEGNSPTEFDAGGYTFGNVLGNVDVSRQFNNVTWGIGLEARSESFEVRAGQEESYVGGGAQSFPGLQPSNALDENRTNFGIYTSLDVDVSEEFLISGALRFENYSDFGSNLSWKIASRLLLNEGKGAIRASVNTGFRAPSLHQIYLSNIQTLVSGGTVSNQGTFNNVSNVVSGLGIPQLDAETSFNFAAGITYKFTETFSVSADYYNIDLNDRVLFTGEIGFDGNDATDNPVESVLRDFDVTSIKFFVNAMDTKTSGLDFVANYGNIELGTNSSLDFIFALNANSTKIDGQIVAPGVVGAEGYDIFSRKEQSRVTTSRPNLKFNLGATLNVGKFNAALNNTFFGEVTWQHADDPGKDQTFGSRVITDLLLGLDVAENFNIDLTVNNLFNVYPDPIDPKGDFVTDLGGRFKWPWEVNQFGFNGTIVKLGVSFNF